MRDELGPGSQLGKYEILRKLATGGMAELYLARMRGQAGFEKVVVLKRILPALAEDREFVTMFLDEARVAAALRHSNIAAVIDVGEENGIYFLTMEYVHGEDVRSLRLRAEVREQPIPLEVTLAIVEGVAGALAYAHGASGPKGPLNIVHRDVSPSNILVGHDGGIKLIDFGIARATMRVTETRTGTAKGKIPYMSPEQARAKTLDRRSDLFSLGIVLYELTTDDHPFRDAGELDTLEALVAGNYPRPSSKKADYPRELDDIVMRLLQRDVNARYSSARELLDDLERFITSHGIRSSALVVQRYMRDLFGPPVEAEFPDERLEPTQPRARPTPPSVDIPRNAFGAEPSGSEKSIVLDPSTGLRTANIRDIMMTPVSGVPLTPPPAPTPTHPPEETHYDIVPMFDPIEARRNEILAHLDDEAPANEADADRTRRRIEQLLARAYEWAKTQQLDRAVVAIELALTEDPESVISARLVSKHRDAIVDVLAAYVGGERGLPALARPLEDMSTIPLETRAAYLLSRVDGSMSVGDLADVSGMSRLETYRVLAQLVLRGVLVVVGGT